MYPVRIMRCVVAVLGLMLVATVELLAQSSQPRSGLAVCTPSLGMANLDFTLNDSNGRPVTLSTYRGKVLVINFWATWCEPCKVEIPGFKELYDRYRHRSVDVIGVDVGESVTQVRPYVSSMRINYPILMSDQRQDVLEAFDVHVGLPTTVIVNRDGSICQRRVGFTRKERFDETIRALLAGVTTAPKP